ncbi:cyclase family protein [Flagellimonas meridianipacifica]|uniref:Kynurenine formamidase n=1 Tax=Flagellimonas meridianipacifica TaxID=1080225 RepID=A0A2T0MJ27_9FLAO|nr:cyclase family protein [Allomuricauda pacifica]PRX57555.1 kynurenine formamidase [Allomuricauda pacifica]
MIATITRGSTQYQIDLANPIDISIPLVGGKDNVNAWYLEPPIIEPVKTEGFIGKVAEGGSVNFNMVHFNPHSHVTHTECSGHITREVHSVNRHLNNYFFWAKLVTVAPEKIGDDFAISAKQLEYVLDDKSTEALIIRTIPNVEAKRSKDYSNTNPAYLLEEAIHFLVDHDVKHLLVDLPSVDKERDGGQLASHKAFWNIGGEERSDATITELIYVPNTIEDGMYWLNLQVAPFENDAAPSRPVLFKILET